MPINSESVVPETYQSEKTVNVSYSGQIIRDARHEKRMTQAELASRIGSTKSYISKIENGTMTPSVSTFYRIIRALGLQINISHPLIK